MCVITCLGITFEIRPLQKNITCYHMVESFPFPVNEGLAEILKNGETKIISSTTHDDPDTTHFELRTVLENVSTSVWVFKQYRGFSVKYIVYSNLPKDKIKIELYKMLMKNK